MSRIWYAIRTRQVVAVAVVTVLTLAIIGGILITSTSLGCGPAKALGLKTIGSGCNLQVASRTPGLPSPSSQSSVNPSFAASPSPSISASPVQLPSPSPLPTATVPDTGPASGAYPPFYPATTGSNGIAVPAKSLNCRLPVFAGPPGSGGFIVYPGGSYVADPASAVSLPSPPPGQPSPIGQPQQGQGYQPNGMAYDAAYSKWVPVSYTQLTPDGSKYAFLSASSIYVENVADGTLSQIGQGQAWTLVSVQSAGVYAMQQNKAGLWLVPYSGDPHLITAGGFWQAGSADSAYGTATSAVPNGAENQILRVDLHTGAVSVWFTRQGTQSTVMGVDAGGAVILNVTYFDPNGYTIEVWVVAAPGHGVPIAGQSPYNSGVNLTGPPIADGNGIWFQAYGNGQGIALYVKGVGIYWMSSLSAQLAGRCVKP